MGERNGPGRLRRACAWWFGAPRVGREGALAGAERVGALTALIGSAEYLAGGTQAGPGQLNDLQLIASLRGGPRGPLLPHLWSPLGNTLFHTGRLVAAGALLLPTGRRVRLAAGTYLAATSWVLLHTESRGLDGSDEVGILLQSAGAIARVRDDPAVADAALWFLTAQSGLSYLSAGVAKAISPVWTGTGALTGIFRTRTYGHERVWRVLRDHPAMARRASQAVVVGELAMPALLVAGRTMARSYVALGFAFHAANAAGMGLGRFMIAFSGMYPPALYVCSQDAPSRTVLRRAGAIVALAVGASAARAVREHRGLRALPEAGAVAAARAAERRGGAAAGERAPLIVLVAGLGETAHHVEPLRRELAARGHAAIAYTRAGYPGTGGRHAGVPDFAVLVDECARLAEEAADGRPVVLVGHSLGGAIAARCAERPGVAVAGVVVLDSAHPAQWERLAASLTLGRSTHRVVEASLRIGLGSALEVPVEVGRTDPVLRGHLAAIQRSPITWRAMRWELAAMTGHPATPLRPRCPVLAITAGGTAQADPQQAELDRALGHRHTILPGVSHLDLLLDPATVSTVAGHVAAHAAECAPAGEPDLVGGGAGA